MYKIYNKIMIFFYIVWLFNCKYIHYDAQSSCKLFFVVKVFIDSLLIFWLFIKEDLEIHDIREYKFKKKNIIIITTDVWISYINEYKEILTKYEKINKI